MSMRGLGLAMGLGGVALFAAGMIRLLAAEHANLLNMTLAEIFTTTGAILFVGGVIAYASGEVSATLRAREERDLSIARMHVAETAAIRQAAQARQAAADAIQTGPIPVVDER